MSVPGTKVVDLERLSAMLSMMSEVNEHWRSFLALREEEREREREWVVG